MPVDFGNFGVGLFAIFGRNVFAFCRRIEMGYGNAAMASDDDKRKKGKMEKYEKKNTSGLQCNTVGVRV